MKRVQTPQSTCRIGMAQGDITPPVGIYHRMWGAATHDRSTGVHRPLAATVMHQENIAGSCSPADARVLVGLDHCLLRPGEMNELLDRIASRSQTARESLVVLFSHTHSAGLMEYERQSLPGGDLIPAYLDDLADTVAALVRQARQQRQPAAIVYGTGHCSLATNRDFYDDQQDQYVCGHNPTGITDDTLLVARVTDQADRLLGTMVNYACHPTTLAWENTLISPDYVGAMREVVQQATDVPCLFIQGASGDLGPRDGFVGETAIADRNGRQLGYAALSALQEIPRAGTDYEYDGAVISGATLGIWKYVTIDQQRQSAASCWQSEQFEVPLKYRSDLPQAEQLERDRERWRQEELEATAAGDALRARDARAMVERMTRGLARIQHLPPGDWFPYPVQLWAIGDGLWIALNSELYNLLQRELRQRFPDVPLVVATLANGSDISYLPDKDSYGKGLYQEDASVLASGCLETLIEGISDKIRQLGMIKAPSRE